MGRYVRTLLAKSWGLWIPACAGMTDWFPKHSLLFEEVRRVDGVAAMRVNNYATRSAPLQNVETKKMQTPGSSFPPIRAAIVANDFYIPALVCNYILQQ
jgi:hypothetical protein